MREREIEQTVRAADGRALNHATKRFRRAAAMVLCLVAAASCPAAWAPVPALDLTGVDPALLTDDELTPAQLNVALRPFAYYLAHFDDVANAVTETGPNAGFIDIPVWRDPADNEPFNARVMENQVALAYFYTTPRPWNPHHGSAAVRDRLETAMRFWIDMQNSDGRFSEYGYGQWNLSATAFSTKFMGQTLVLLQNGGPTVDPALLQEATAAHRKAIMYTLNSDANYNSGGVTSNQYENVFAGALAYLSLRPDAEMETKLQARFTSSRDDFQSPAGFYYERSGADWGYNFGTHHSNTRMIYHYTRGSAMGEQLVASERNFIEWLSYNAVPIPGRPGFLYNRALETRTQTAMMDPMDYSLGDRIELARAFSVTVEDRAARAATARSAWPDAEPLAVGDFQAYSPYAFLHRDHYRWDPTDARREAATRLLPYLASDRFLHQRADDGAASTVCTYVRRDDYYAAFNAGPRRTSQQRFGLGLLWSPIAGAFIQSQTASDSFAWGTRASGAGSVHEASSLFADYRVDGEAVRPETGARDLEDGLLTITYDLGSVGSKTVAFADTAVRVDVNHPGAFFECIPLLTLESDTLEYDNERIRLFRGRMVLGISIEGADQVDYLASSTDIDVYRLCGFSIAASDSLGYSIALTAALPGDATYDGRVDDSDARSLAQHWLQTDASWGDGDFNADGVVNDLDAAILAAHWRRGRNDEPSAAAPEPSTLFLLVAAAPFVWMRRRGRMRPPTGATKQPV